MKRKVISFLSMSVVVVAQLIPAASYGQAAGTGPNPFSECGIGAAMFPETTWAAVSSNIIWDAGTTAVTSATASPQTCISKNVQTAQFILDTYDSVLEETAKGTGDHLTTMLNILGCAQPSHVEIITSIRHNIASSINQVSYHGLEKVEKASQYYDAVMDADVNSCS